MLRTPFRRSLLAAVLLIPAAGMLGASDARAGCHLVDCVENVYVAPAEVQKKSCEDLWILRNSIFKDAGYCFATGRARSWFGNEGCRYSDQALVPLNSYQSHNAHLIATVEKRKAC